MERQVSSLRAHCIARGAESFFFSFFFFFKIMATTIPILSLVFLVLELFENFFSWGVIRLFGSKYNDKVSSRLFDRSQDFYQNTRLNQILNPLQLENVSGE